MKNAMMISLSLFAMPAFASASEVLLRDTFRANVTGELVQLTAMKETANSGVLKIVRDGREASVAVSLSERADHFEMYGQAADGTGVSLYGIPRHEECKNLSQLTLTNEQFAQGSNPCYDDFPFAGN